MSFPSSYPPGWNAPVVNVRTRTREEIIQETQNILAEITRLEGLGIRLPAFAPMPLTDNDEYIRGYYHAMLCEMRRQHNEM